MKRLGTIMIALTALLFAACPDKKGNDEQVEKPAGDKSTATETVAPVQREIAEVEPNEKTGQAMEIKDSCVVNGTLEAAAGPKNRAVDWYKIAPPGKKVLKVRISPVAADDVSLTFLDADRNELFGVDSGGPGEGEVYPNLTIERGAYLRVRGAAGGKGGAYRLVLEFSEPVTGQEVEFNGRYSTANELKVGEQVTGYLGHKRDEDWYLVNCKDLATGSVLRIDLAAVTGVRFALEILDGEERAPILKCSSEKIDQGIVVRNLGLPASGGAIFVVVKSAWVPGPKPKKFERTANAEKTYSLSISSETGGDDLEREPDDDAGHAMSVLDGQKMRGYMESPSDVDWYKIEVERPSLLSAELSALDRVDLQLYVVDPEKKDQKRDFALVRINDGGVGEPEILTNCALKPGENYVRVEGVYKKVDGKWVRDFYNLDETYSLTLTLRSDDGREEREPNRKPERATAIKIGDTLRGTLHPQGDVDMYVLDLSGQDGPHDTLIECSGIPKLDIGIALLGPEQDQDGKLKQAAISAQGKGEATESIKKELMPGVYHIKVWGTPRTESNTRDQYLLTVTQP
ncbi:MAG TPA: hypothetical protein VM425_13855 [Myxococcota bacterium]|nr:hypothetical protein [Myxococcota bacterium]